jgi:hypothetical protein
LLKPEDGLVRVWNPGKKRHKELQIHLKKFPLEIYQQLTEKMERNFRTWTGTGNSNIGPDSCSYFSELGRILESPVIPST